MGQMRTRPFNPYQHQIRARSPSLHLSLPLSLSLFLSLSLLPCVCDREPVPLCVCDREAVPLCVCDREAVPLCVCVCVTVLAGSTLGTPRLCVQEHIRIKVHVRSFKGLRGVCVGFAVAFDKFWN